MSFIAAYTKASAKVAEYKNLATLPNATGRPTRCQLLALALHTAGRQVTTQEFTVAAWRMFPDVYGLGGYNHLFPDHSLVKTRLYDDLLPRKWVSKTGKYVKLTGRGRDVARRLLESSEEVRGVHKRWAGNLLAPVPVGDVQA